MTRDVFVMLMTAGLSAGVSLPVVWWLLRLEAQRRERLQAWAARRGWSFAPRAAEAGMDVTLWQLPLFRRHSRPTIPATTGITNVMHGTVGAQDVWIFDMRYSAGESSTALTLAAWPVAGRTLPAFEWRHQSIVLGLEATLDGLDWQDVPLGNAGATDVPYRLRSSVPAAAQALFARPSVIAFFREHADWDVEGAGSWLLIYPRARTRVAPEGLDRWLERVAAVQALVSQ